MLPRVHGDMEILFATESNAEETTTALEFVEENGSEDFEVSNAYFYLKSIKMLPRVHGAPFC